MRTLRAIKNSSNIKILLNKRDEQIQQQSNEIKEIK